LWRPRGALVGRNPRGCRYRPRTARRARRRGERACLSGVRPHVPRTAPVPSAAGDLHAACSPEGDRGRVPRSYGDALCSRASCAGLLGQTCREDGALWCRALADHIDFTVDYQPWVVANFSGIQCVDEVYQGELALLLAVDPSAPDGDRLVGYILLSKTREVDQGMVKAFVDGLRTVGITPDQVITDDSRLYPSVLADTWPTAMHQLCLFHATRRVVHAVNDVVKHVRRSLPTPPPASRPTLLGSLRRTPPAADQHDADSEPYRRRVRASGRGRTAATVRPGIGSSLA
jgi:hypothetical protein